MKKKVDKSLIAAIIFIVFVVVFTMVITFGITALGFYTACLIVGIDFSWRITLIMWAFFLIMSFFLS